MPYVVIHRLREFYSLSLFGPVSDVIKNIAPRMSVHIPTREMIVVAEKVNIR
jgi:hypothetical protein